MIVSEPVIPSSRMGIDVNRFAESVDEEFKCSICLNVLEKPVHGTCGHVFCRLCIMTWLESGGPVVRPGHRRVRAMGTCPVDRQTLHQDDLMDAALPFKALLSRLKIKCEYTEYGCSQVVTVASLPDHVKVCNFNPEELIECKNGCAKLYPRKHLIRSKHNCIKELQSLIQNQQQAISDLQSDKNAFQRSCKNLNYIVTVLIAILIGVLMTALVPDATK